MKPSTVFPYLLPLCIVACAPSASDQDPGSSESNLTEEENLGEGEVGKKNDDKKEKSLDDACRQFGEDLSADLSTVNPTFYDPKEIPDDQVYNAKLSKGKQTFFITGYTYQCTDNGKEYEPDALPDHCGFSIALDKNGQPVKKGDLTHRLPTCRCETDTSASKPVSCRAA